VPHGDARVAVHQLTGNARVCSTSTAVQQVQARLRLGWRGTSGCPSNCLHTCCASRAQDRSQRSDARLQRAQRPLLPCLIHARPSTHPPTPTPPHARTRARTHLELDVGVRVRSGQQRALNLLARHVRGVHDAARAVPALLGEVQAAVLVAREAGAHLHQLHDARGALLAHHLHGPGGEGGDGGSWCVGVCTWVCACVCVRARHKRAPAPVLVRGRAPAAPVRVGARAGVHNGSKTRNTLPPASPPRKPPLPRTHCGSLRKAPATMVSFTWACTESEVSSTAHTPPCAYCVHPSLAASLVTMATVP